MAQTRFAVALRASDVNGVSRWLAVGYLAPAALIGMLFLAIRLGPTDAHSYNYAMLAMLVLSAAAAVAIVCFLVASILSLSTLIRASAGGSRWQYLAVALSAAPLSAMFWMIARVVSS